MSVAASLISEEAVKAKYQVNRNVFVSCYLDVIEATPAGLKTQIGIRVPGDTILPVGTKLYISPTSSKSSAPQNKDEFETFSVTVRGIEIEKSSPVQICSPILKESFPERRLNNRKQGSFKINIEEAGETLFIVRNGSVRGLTLQYKTTGALMGLVLYHKYILTTVYKDKPISFPAEVIHIHYDWRTNQHMMGVKFVQLSPEHELIMKHLTDPNFVEIQKKATVDTEEAIIRPDK